MLNNEDTVWFYSENTGELEWKDIKKLFIVHFRKKFSSSLDQVAHEKFVSGNLFEFFKNKLALIDKHYPNIDTKDKLQMVLSCLPSQQTEELLPSLKLNFDKFMNLVQGYSIRNKLTGDVVTSHTNATQSETPTTSGSEQMSGEKVQRMITSSIDQLLTTERLSLYIRDYIKKISYLERNNKY